MMEEYTVGMSETALPLVTTSAMPVSSWFTPRVASIGGMWILEISTPLSAPAAQPITAAITSTSATMKADTVPLSPARERMYMAISMLVRLATPTLERSMPPVIMHSIAPRAITPNSGNLPAMVWKLAMV